MNVSLRQLKGFVLVARLGNFTRAAEQLHISQAGLSVMMRELETQLDSRLFDRTTRYVRLTTAGEKLLPAALAAVGELEAAAAQISNIGEKARQTLRVAATPLVSSTLLPAVCRSFRKQYPEVTIRLIDSDLKRVHALVESGEADVGLGFFFQAARGIERTLLYSFQLMRVAPLDEEPIGTMLEQACMSAEDVNPSEPGTVPWSALENAPLIGLPPDNPIQQLVETHLAKIGRSNEDRLTFSHFDTLIAMVAAGMGTAIIPSFAMPACRRHRVSTELLSHPAVTIGFYRITKRGRAKAHSLLDFTDTLVSLLPGMAAIATTPPQ
jgi:DNA-binding transcriptional LysR family regulator